MPEKTKKQIDEAFDRNELTTDEYMSLMATKREKNRDKQKKYRMVMRNSRILGKSHALRRLDVALPSGLIDDLSEWSKSSVV
jgi:hypothetical protein